MRKPRTIILLIATILVAVGLTGHAWLVGRAKHSTILGSGVGQITSHAVPVSGVVFSSGKTSAKSESRRASAPVFSETARPELSGDEAALVAEMCELQLLSHDTTLTLTGRQWSSLAAVVLHTQAVRQTYEAEIATSQVIAPGQYRLEIPAYGSAGDMLRENFNTQLRTELGEAAAAEVLQKLGSRLEARFAGFGVSVQTLDITGNPEGALSDVQITRTVTYWNRTEGSAGLTTRREVHFPAFEDPTGDSWIALLAMVKTS